MIAALLFGMLAVGQVLTVGPGGRVHRTSALTKSERAILLPALQDSVGDHNPDLLASFSIFEEPLSRTGIQAIIAISVKNCGVHGNCPFLVFRQKGSVDVPILNSVAGDWDLKDTRHHTYRDIVLTNYQGIHQVITTWQFDGQTYRVSTCIGRTANTQKKLPVSECGF